MEYDVIVIGAGLAGLTAAKELARAGASFAVLEAQEHIGGRARSIHTPGGLAVDLGGHWLHGKNNPLEALLKEYAIPTRKDSGEHMTVYLGGQTHRRAGDWLEEAADPKKARAIKTGELPDCPLPDIARDEESRQLLIAFGRLWYAIEPPLYPSAREFLTDRSTPGGLQIEGGVGRLLDKLAEEIPCGGLHLSTPVRRILSTANGVRATSEGGREWRARQALFTGSPGVLKSGLVAFDPPLSDGLMRYLDGAAIGRMNKIIVELAPGFLRDRNIPIDSGFELADSEPPYFCHVHSAGAPLISLFITGPHAEKVERFTAAEALDYMVRALRPVTELNGFEQHVAGVPIVTRWVHNPSIRGAYGALLPGGERGWPRREGNVWVCGDSFDPHYPASMAGASRSGKAAALLALEALQETRAAG